MVGIDIYDCCYLAYESYRLEKIANKLRWYTYRTTCNSTSADHRKLRMASNICLDSILLTKGLVTTSLMSTTWTFTKNLISWRKIAKNLRRYTYKIAYKTNANGHRGLRKVANDF